MEFKTVIDVKSLSAKCPMDPCFVKLIVRPTEALNNNFKLESKKELVLRNGKVDINEQFEVPMADKGQDRKVTMVIMASKGKEVSLLGVANIDLKGTENQNSLNSHQIKLDKCSDNKALLVASTFVRDKLSSQQTSDMDRMQGYNAAKTVNWSLNDSNESAIAKSSRDRALQISRRNFKHSQITREKSTSRDVSGSYKKRFEYQQKSIPSTHVFQKKTEKMPVERRNTPEPIQFDPVNERMSKSKPKIKQGSFSSKDPKEAYKKENSVKLPKQQNVKEFKDHYSHKERSFKDQSVDFSDNMSYRLNTQESEVGKIVNNRSPSKNSPGSKYASLATKLQLIQRNVRQNNTNLDTSRSNSVPEVQKFQTITKNDDSICTFGDGQDIKSQPKYATSNEAFGASLKTSLQFNRNIDLLQSTIREQERHIKELEHEKQQNQEVIRKLTRLYESQQLRTVQVCQKCPQYRLEIDRYQRQIEKVNKENQNLRKQLASKSPKEIQAELLNERRKALNLASEIKFKQNELKFAKLNEDSLKAEKKQLEQEIRKLQMKQPMERRESRAELESQFMNSYPSTLRTENRLLKDQVQLLQKQNDQLNNIIEKGLKPREDTGCMEHLVLIDQKDTEIASLKKINKVQEEKYNALSQKAVLLEQDLIKTKNNFCEAMNAALEKGGADLVDFIESKMTFKQS